MASGSTLKRIEIPYFEGINSLVGNNLAKKTELAEIENAHTKKIGVIEKRHGYKRLGDDISATANYGLVYFDDAQATSNGFWRVSTVAATTKLYYLNSSAVWTAVSDGDATVSAARCDFTIAEGNLFIVNGTDANRYVSNDGTTVTTSASSGHLKNSPIAYKINYYKDRLYLGDYTATTRYKNGIMRSSVPLGIVTLVDGDHAVGVTTITVTDAKYVYSSDSLDVYRGGTLIETITVTGKAENTITVNATANAINSADELWVAGTYTGARQFRWADNPKSGEAVKQYDTFKLSGGQNDSLTMMTNIGDVMVVANKHNLTLWNDYNLQNLELGIGCASNNGYTKAMGVLFFIHYTGIYATSGDRPTLISAKVQRYFDGATLAGIEAAALGKSGMSIFASIGNVTLYNDDGSTQKTLSNVVLEYNLREENWFVHTGIPADRFATYFSSTDVDRAQFTHSTNFNVYEMMRNDDTWFEDGSSSSSTEIPFLITTPPVYLSTSFENICYPKEIVVEVERGSAIKCFIALDDGQFYELSGEASKGATRIKVKPRLEIDESPVRCRRIRVSLREYSKRGCKISRVAIIYSDSPDVEDQRG